MASSPPEPTRDTITRAGRFATQPTGYRAFIPNPLPPEPPLEIDSKLLLLLSHADLAVGRLDGIAQNVPDPDRFVAMYVNREAVLSSQIEGTQSTLEDLLAAGLDGNASRVPADVDEIVNYVAAMNYGLERLATLPVSLRLIREIHSRLLRGTRGAQRTLGEFRTTQNWIGPPGAPIAAATFVPPPTPDMGHALDRFEKFLHAAPELPPLIEVGLVHAQFETIHPFLDGNGRVGRLLIAFLLVHKGVLRQPLLYLSHYFKLHRAEYYDRLMAIRLDGDWEGWLRFFLRGVAETAVEARSTAQRISDLRERHRQLIVSEGIASNGLVLLALLYRRPIVNVRLVARELGMTFQTANVLVRRVEALGILQETTGARRNRTFRYGPYLEFFADPVGTPTGADEVVATVAQT
ncbi:MAG TPA: Fic family protein [Solirubrobacteraceae bacterium]|jgi:Fic family protein|nr:Fic family protein [Solirubrobacteraceae bacterium]